MRITLPYQQDRDEERARLARWFGDSDFGPVYFAARGRAVPISADERDLWLTRAWRLCDRHLVQQRWVGFEALAIAIVLGSFTSLAANLAGDVVPFLRSVPPPLVGLCGLAWPIVHDQFYRRRLRALRQEIHARTRERLALDPVLIGYGRRYNLLAGAMLVAVLGSIAWTCIAAIGGGQGAGQLPVVALLVVVLALHMTGRRIDDNQRRRLPKR